MAMEGVYFHQDGSGSDHCRTFLCGGQRANLFRTPQGRLLCDYLAAIGVPIAVPMTSPEITSSTRRFCCRPPAVSLDATGCDLPKPLAVTESPAIPCCTR